MPGPSHISLLKSASEIIAQHKITVVTSENGDFLYFVLARCISKISHIRLLPKKNISINYNYKRNHFYGCRKIRSWVSNGVHEFRECSFIMPKCIH